MSTVEPTTRTPEAPLGRTRHAATDVAAGDHSPRIDAARAAARNRRRSDPVDRLGDAYQQARLLRRRRQREVALAVACESVPVVRAAMTRYRAAVAWEHRCERRFLRAALTAYLYRPDPAAWTDRFQGMPAGVDTDPYETNEQEAQAWT